jgi:hypothetical protein
LALRRSGTSKLDGARHRLANKTLSSLAGKTLHLSTVAPGDGEYTSFFSLQLRALLATTALLRSVYAVSRRTGSRLGRGTRPCFGRLMTCALDLGGPGFLSYASSVALCSGCKSNMIEGTLESLQDNSSQSPIRPEGLLRCREMGMVLPPHPVRSTTLLFSCAPFHNPIPTSIIISAS